MKKSSRSQWLSLDGLVIVLNKMGIKNSIIYYASYQYSSWQSATGSILAFSGNG